MIKGNNGDAQAIFQSIRADGTCWRFMTQPDQGWAITCDGKTVVVGTGNNTSISSGIRKYLSFTSATKPRLQAARAWPGERSQDRRIDHVALIEQNA